jgi:hypothetical protein
MLADRGWFAPAYRLGVDSCDALDNFIARAAYLRELLDHYGAPGFPAAYNQIQAR